MNAQTVLWKTVIKFSIILQHVSGEWLGRAFQGNACVNVDSTQVRGTYHSPACSEAFGRVHTHFKGMRAITASRCEASLRDRQREAITKQLQEQHWGCEVHSRGHCHNTSDYPTEVFEKCTGITPSGEAPVLALTTTTTYLWSGEVSGTFFQQFHLDQEKKEKGLRSKKQM
jgi:hypothetical protein